MATTIDCLLHPIDCARASEAARTATGTLAATSGAVSGTTAGATTEAEHIAEAATGPLSQIADTSMWVTIGVIAVAIVFLAVFFYIVYRVEIVR